MIVPLTGFHAKKKRGGEGMGGKAGRKGKLVADYGEEVEEVEEVEEEGWGLPVKRVEEWEQNLFVAEMKGWAADRKYDFFVFVFVFVFVFIFLFLFLFLFLFFLIIPL